MVPAPMLGVNNQTTIFLETVTSNTQSTILKCPDYSTNQQRDIECKETLGMLVLTQKQTIIT